MSCKTKNSAYSNQDAVSQISGDWCLSLAKSLPIANCRFKIKQFKTADKHPETVERMQTQKTTINIEICRSLVAKVAEIAKNSLTSSFPTFFNQLVEFKIKYTYFTYMFIEFIETRSFSQIVNEQLTAEEFRKLQLELMATPLKGELIQNTGGARKIRVAKYGKGKRGGARVIYYIKDEGRIWFLFLYVKSEKENLTRAECNAIHDVVKAIKELEI